MLMRALPAYLKFGRVVPPVSAAALSSDVQRADAGGHRRGADPFLRPHMPLRLTVKRAIDVAGALVVMAVLLPVFLIISAIVRSDGGPVLFRHKRVGRGGQAFGCLKFRTMVVDGDAVLETLLRTDERARAEWATTRKLRNDPRITPLGGILRACSLDELPQLINVLRGEMSLVGPRPVTQSEIDAFYGEAAAEYRSVRPGLTGPWQVGGRSETSYSERVALDSSYARNLSIRNDMKILLLTFPAVLRRRGAV
jgi:lipopolysaccharide/colanic/teichoic acid biosynthesis glycosyltransferase